MTRQNETIFLQKLNTILTGWNDIKVLEPRVFDGIAAANVSKRQIMINFNRVERDSKDFFDYFKKIKALNYHELSHLLYTTTTANMFMGFNGLHQIHNMLEDGRIESLFGMEYPKAFDYFKRTAYEFIINVPEKSRQPESFILVYGRKL